MTKFLYSSLGVLVSLLYVSIRFLFTELENVDLIFSALMLCLLGIPHGAVDHLVAKRIAESRAESFNLFGFMAKYLGVMAIYGIIWQFFPQISFVVFIGISIFHFGDIESTSTRSSAKSSKDYVVQIIRSSLLGLGILGFILFSHPMEVNTILANLSLGSTFRMVSVSPVYCMILVLIGFQKEHLFYFINTIVTLLIGIYLPLIPAFMCYFGACHATYSLRVLSESLSLPFSKLYVKLMPLTIAAIAMGMGYVSFVSSEKWLAHSFIFLSILTMPHFFLMHQISHRTAI